MEWRSITRCATGNALIPPFIPPFEEIVKEITNELNKEDDGSIDKMEVFNSTVHEARVLGGVQKTNCVTVLYRLKKANQSH